LTGLRLTLFSLAVGRIFMVRLSGILINSYAKNGLFYVISLCAVTVLNITPMLKEDSVE
jgi:hypothetical protein